MKNMNEVYGNNRLGFEDLDMVSGGGDDMDFSMFDPADKLTREQMITIALTVSYHKGFGKTKEQMVVELEPLIKCGLYGFDIKYYAVKYWDVADKI